MPASPYASPVSTSPYCAECLEPAEPLMPARPLRHPEKWATPKYCLECYPKHKDRLKRRLTDRANFLRHHQENPTEWARSKADHEYFDQKVVGAGAVLSPLVELMRTQPLPPQVRLPQFVWELPAGGSDAYSAMRRGMRYQDGAGWLAGSFDAHKRSHQGSSDW